MKTTKEKGCYVRRPCCKDCDWFSLPDFVNGWPVPPRTICPKCGGELVIVTGRYTIETDKGLFGLSENRRYTEFERKSV